MALSRLLFMAARIVASNPRLRKEVQKAAEASYTKAKPYINKANENNIVINIIPNPLTG